MRVEKTKLNNKTERAIMIFSVFMILSLLVPTEVFAKDTDTTAKSSDESILVAVKKNSKYYVSGNEVIKVSSSNPTLLSSYTSIDGDLTKNYIADIKFYTANVNEEEKVALLSYETKSGALTKINEALTSYGQIKARLTVTYDNSAGGVTGLHLCKATGSYTHLGYESGIVGKSSELHYSATGSVYSNGVFVKNGTIGFTRKYSSPKFSSIQLMPEGTCVKGVTTAGITYTLYCSRGVSVSVYMPW